jgi:glycolate oxidase FAD binding subunit
MVGALGTLGMIATATFRLHPLPEMKRTIRVHGLTASGVLALVRRMREDQLEPAAVAALGAASGLDVLVRFEGFAAGVRDQCESVAALVPELAQSVDVLSTAEAALAWTDHDAQRTRGHARVKLSTLPASLPAVASDAVLPLTGALSMAATVWYPTLGLGFVSGGVEDRDAFARAIVRARTALARLGGSLVIQDLPISMRGAVDVWGPPPAALSLMRRVKNRFDPDNRLNPGRFVGGL